ncbi:uncharacterized protein LOC119604840 [Lucilia sericata]|uniref:uncharacterized protein LOC119604840 n=1 Tax=Lucilia sericata TaxID=13632 RepID=UPI0018A82FB0|nr:uncharacterized protein LOC119604840 [Lucilia sericata]
MEQNLFNQLGLTGKQEPLELRWTGDTTRSENNSVKINIEISGSKSDNRFTLYDVHTVNNLGLPIQSLNFEDIVRDNTYLKGLPIQSYTNAKPMVLIGLNNWRLAVPLKIREGARDQPIATKTRLGWTLQGSGTDLRSIPSLNIHTCECENRYRALHNEVKEYFGLDAPHEKNILSPKNNKAMEILEATTIKKNQQFEVGLLWKEEVIQLPESYEVARHRLTCLQKKFKKDPQLQQTMQAEIDKLICKGYARKVSEEEMSSNAGRIWYLPIFVALNPNKPGKVRLVWDAAAKSHNKSLNDFLICGPDLLTSLFNILIEFRVGQIAICGDIAEMFHRINVKDEDMHAQRFLWFENGNICAYVMKALTFGISCAPCIAHFVRNRNADYFRNEYPRAVKAIQCYHYMDDFIDSVDTEDEAKELAVHVRLIHSAGGFHMRNWVTNSVEVRQHLSDDGSATQTSFKAIEKILVLKWLSMDPKNFKEFVMYRVGEILEFTNVTQWSWVPSKLNPADYATKICAPDEDMWLNGPVFLRGNKHLWPKCPDLGGSNKEEIRNHLLVIDKSNRFTINVEYFSNWKRLYMALSQFLLYIEKLKYKAQGSGDIPDGIRFEYIQRSKNILFKYAQASEFLEEIWCLQHNKKIHSGSKLKQLNVFLDENGIIRACGRVESLNCNNAIILPNSHYITFLLVRNFHENFHHCLHEATICRIKTRFYIPKLRTIYKSVRAKCQRCKNQLVVPQPPLMASLPAARLASFERPFTYVGIDFFGPLYVVVGRRREKRWGVLFTCLTVRAIHIEVAYSLDTSSCIMCIQNFISRRGSPKEVYTDNGTNFKSVERVLREEKQNIDLKQVFDRHDEIKWRFNPPAAPHMGGAWERLVRTVKTILYAMCPAFKFNDESLKSAFCEIEFIINSRPLTFVALDSAEDDPLTPNHLLLGSADGWPKGVITEIITAKDGQVRRVKVRINTSTFERPVTKIAVLDVGNTQESKLMHP